MVRNVDYESRRMAVLTQTINKYIQEAEPVSSGEISSEFDLSSATIRNIFAELEENGYLMHPHTSGGRVPTDRGYRYYVDFLIAQMELLDEEKGRIVNEFKREIRRLEDALEEASEIISRITHYAGIVSLLESGDKFFYRGIGHILDQPEFQDIRKMRMLIKVLEEKKNLLEVINRDFSERVKVYIGKETGCPEMENCSLIVSNYKRRNKPSGRLAVLGPVRMEYKQIIPTVEYISEVLSEMLEEF